MLRTCSFGVALTAMVAGPSMTAQAADTTLTLACQGTATTIVKDAKPEPVSIGIIVNFAARTVTGFEGDYPEQPVSHHDARANARLQRK